MIIVGLKAENVKRLKAVDITPSGELVVIGGRNGQGKTSVLDAISAALGGKREAPEVPVRAGEETAKVVLDLGDVKVTRRWRKSGESTLVVENGDGATYKSPQALLDGLVGKLSFDPLAFMRLEGKAQLDALRDIVGLDTKDLETEKVAVYEQRRDLGRELKALRARLDAMPVHDDAPVSVDVAGLLRELEVATEHNAKLADDLRSASDVAAKASSASARIEEVTKRWDEAVATLEEQLRVAKAKRTAAIAEAIRAAEAARDAHLERQDSLEGREEVDVAPIQAALRESEGQNRRAREHAERCGLEAQATELDAKIAAATARLDALDAERRARIEAAPFPVDGLGFCESGVTFRGLPLSQASGAEQLRVSVAIGAALNKRLRVMLVRDGSLLDEQSMAALAAFAREHGLQVWIERVSTDATKCHVVIEDGEVVP